jgi:hypothetical protein
MKLVPVVAALAFITATQAATAPHIAVFVDFESQPSPQSVQQMRTEVAAILKPSGLTLDWHSLQNRESTQSYPDLVVLRFKGSCQVRNPPMDSELGPALEPAALATTAVSDGHVLPFTDVRCNEIRRYLHQELEGHQAAKQEQIYGRALGRVVAHELYHIFAATEEHATEGVARSFHTRRDLTNKTFRFSEKETTTLHELKWRALLTGEAQAVSW